MSNRNRDWMALPRASAAYISGVDGFLDMAFQKTAQGQEILCPCKKCLNRNWYYRAMVRDHLIVYGFVKGYTEWVFHGEGLSMYSEGLPPHSERLDPLDMDAMLQDVYRDVAIGEQNLPKICEGPNTEAKKSYKLMEEGRQELYPGVMGGKRPGRAMLFGRSVTPIDLKGKGVSGESSVKVFQNFIEGMKEQMREEVRKEMEEQLTAYKSSLQSFVQQQFLSMVSHLQGLVPGMNINQVPGFSLNFGSPRDVNSAPTQAMRAHYISSASSHEPQGQ